MVYDDLLDHGKGKEMLGSVDHLCKLTVAAQTAKEHGYVHTCNALEGLIKTERNRLFELNRLALTAKTHDGLTSGMTPVAVRPNDGEPRGSH